jgi:hypothetical protein
MKLTLTLAVAGLLASSAPALAQSACTRPGPPAPVDGATVTMDQLMAAKKDVSDFIAASDTYQGCLIDDLNAQRATAKANKTKVDKSVVTDVDAKIKGNQADKESVGNGFNSAIKAYKAAHPS